MAGRKLFDCIAPIYSRYFDFQKRMYQDALQTVASGISLDAYETILDVGCGTGAFAAVMLARGFTVTGIDTSEKMLPAWHRHPPAWDPAWQPDPDTTKAPAQRHIHPHPSCAQTDTE
jgi:trans-aconitate methyltransferase